MRSQRGLFWTMLWLVCAISVWTIRVLVPRLTNMPSAAQLREVVMEERLRHCAPEPAEQLTFILALVVPVCTFVLLLAAFRAAKLRTPERTPWTWLLSAAAWSLQITVWYLGSEAIGFESSNGQRYRFLSVTALGWLLLPIGVLFVDRLKREGVSLQHRGLNWLVQHQWPAWAVATILIANYAITGVFRSEEYPQLTISVRFHLPYTMGEFAAALNGNTPLVDYFPQYQNLLSTLLLPLFRALGFSLLTFSAVMSMLSAFGFLLLYACLRRICESGWLALLLFAPVVAMSFYSEEISPGGYALNAFNYYAVGPLRFFGYCVSAWFALWYLGRPTPARLVAISVVAALVALNNLDFGIPAAVGLLACALSFPPRNLRRNALADLSCAFALFALCTFATWGLYACAIRGFSGSWPRLAAIAEFQRVFALLGYFMIPVPKKGLYWVVYATLMASVAIPLFQVLVPSGAKRGVRHRIRNGSLLFSGIAGTGALAYYIGRSHGYVLEATFFAWSYVTVQLAYRAYCEWKTMRGGQSVVELSVAIVPLAMPIALVALMLPMLAEVPNPIEQYARLTKRMSYVDASSEVVLGKLREYVKPGEATLINYPKAHEIASRAGVRNVFPFIHPGSLVLKRQLDVVESALGKLPLNRPGYVFGDFSPEFVSRLTQRGFARVDTLGNFTVWQRVARSE